MDGEVSRNLKDGIYIVVWLAGPKPWINKLEEPGLNIMESKLDCWRSPVSQMPFESFHFPKQKSPNLRGCPQKNSLELKKLLMFPFLTELCLGTHYTLNKYTGLCACVRVCACVCVHVCSLITLHLICLVPER